MFCKRNRRKVDLSKGEYRSCGGDVCGGWKFVKNRCSPIDYNCIRVGGGAWLPIVSVCAQGLYVPPRVVTTSGPISEPSSSSSSSSMEPYSSSSSSMEPYYSSSSSEGIFLMTEDSKFILTHDEKKLKIDEASSSSMEPEASSSSMEVGFVSGQKDSEGVFSSFVGRIRGIFS